MEKQISEMVRLSREVVCAIWEMSRKGVRLTAAQEQVARVLREHDGYRSAWEIGNVLMDANYTVGDVNPFLHVHLHCAVENQLRGHDPAEVAEVADALAGQGYDRHAIIHAIASVLVDEIYEVTHAGKQFDRKRYVKGLRALADARRAASHDRGGES